MKSAFALWLRNISVLCIICAFTGCKNSGHNGNENDAFDIDLYTPKYAKGFTVKGKTGSGSILIEAKNPWEGAASVNKSLLLLAPGEEPPAEFDGQVLDAPAKRIVAMSSTNVAMLHALDADSTIVGVSGKKFISTPSVSGRPDIVDVGYDSQMNYEALVGAHPDLVLLYGVEGASPMEAKLKEFGIPYLYVGDYLEDSPLGKAEWVVPLAALTSSLAKGVAVFEPIPARYMALKEMGDSLASTRPKVLMNAPYADSWLLPPTGSYAAQLIADAGGETLTLGKESESVIPVSREEALLIGQDADYWLNPGSSGSLSELLRHAPALKTVKCVTEGRVYNNNRRYTPGAGNDYFESGVMQPDIILRDLISILHPEILSDSLYYYQQLK